jgi:hypothetical protein
MLFENTDRSIITATKTLESIYTVAHPNPRCKHDEWDVETLDMYKQLKKQGIL